MSYLFTVSLAGCVFRIETLYPDTMRLCRDYLAEGAAPLGEIRISRRDVENERQYCRRSAACEGAPQQDFTDPYLESLAVYRKIAEQLPALGRMLIHGSALSMDGEGYLFIAKSGTGKSTHSWLWRENFGSRVFMINDDKPILKVSENGVMVYGTPWDGKHRLSRNIGVPLKSVCVLRRAGDNRIRRISDQESYPMLLQQIYHPVGIGSLSRTMELLDLLQKRTPVYLLGCNMDSSAAVISYEGMNNL